MPSGLVTPDATEQVGVFPLHEQSTWAAAGGIERWNNGVGSAPYTIVGQLGIVPVHGVLEQLYVVEIVDGDGHANAVALFGIHVVANDFEADEWCWRRRCADAHAVAIAATALEDGIVENNIAHGIHHLNRGKWNRGGQVYRRHTIADHRKAKGQQPGIGACNRDAIREVEQTWEPGDFDHPWIWVKQQRGVDIIRHDWVVNGIKAKHCAVVGDRQQYRGDIGKVRNVQIDPLLGCQLDKAVLRA